MSDQADELFFTSNDFNRDTAETIVGDALGGCDDGELFLEYRQTEALTFDDGRLKNANFDTQQGFGLRAVAGETAAYAHASELSDAALKRAASSVAAVKAGYGGTYAAHPPGTNRSLYRPDNPLEAMPFEDKVRLLETVDQYARQRDSKIVQVSVSLTGNWQFVEIMRPGGFSRRDIRPLVRFNVSVVTSDGEKRGTGSYGVGGRQLYAEFLSDDKWRQATDEAIRQSLVSLEATPAPAGEMDVVLGPGWPGILLHEAIGHGLEGDFNRKKTSAFAGLLGERIAAPGVTVVDDGTIASRRGSLTIDDEGTPTSNTTLIEDGILVGYMQDRMNARLMGVEPTGNGRRQSYAHNPMPRMTNTYMLSGDKDPEEILASVDKGLLAVSFGGGSVDITSGKFVFSCTEAYRIENGKVGAPVKGATLVGNGADALTRISMVGNDMALDSGIGTCGKQGQGVPVGVGQPTLRLDKITVGGTAA
ncbi:MAG: metalloprotease TldD [Aestuariivirgaceae bacterium]